MLKKQQIIVPRGIQLDTSVSIFPKDAAVDMLNIRLNSLGTDGGNNNTLNLTNEAGNSLVPDIELLLNEVIIGALEIGRFIVLFTQYDEYKNRIIKINLKPNLEEQKFTVLFDNTADMSVKHPIESIGIYENEEVLKVYWVDGVNLPRVININKDYTQSTSSVFDFSPNIVTPSTTDKLISFKVEVTSKSNGNFPAGVVQYAVSYFNKNGQLSGAIYQSPLYYTSNDGLGLNPDGSKKSSQAFKITIANLNPSFEYVRIYRILRTSLDAVPEVRSIGDFKTALLPGNSEVPFLYNKSSNNPQTLTFKYNGIEISDLKGDISNFLNTHELGTNAILINPKDSQNNPRGSIEINIKEDIFNYTYTIPSNQLVTIHYNNVSDFAEQSLTAPYKVQAYLQFPLSVPIIGTTDSRGFITYDTYNIGEETDPLELLFLGSDIIKPKTITHKDNTLFLGNINIEEDFISQEEKKIIKDAATLNFELSPIPYVKDYEISLNQLWIFNSNLDKGSDEITFFLKGEIYRFGIQFLNKQGKWSESIWLGDLLNNIRVEPNSFNDGIKSKPIIKASLDVVKLGSLTLKLKDRYIAARMVCVYPTLQDRNVICQGIVCPTVYNIGDRNDNSPYVQASWFARPSYYKNFGYANKSDITPQDQQVQIYADADTYKHGVPLEYRMVDKKKPTRDNRKDLVIYLPSSKYLNGEISNLSSGIDNDTNMVGKSEEDFKKIFGIDKRIVTMHSPELDTAFTEELYSMSTDNLKFRVVGYSPVKTTLSDIYIRASNPFVPTISNSYNKQIIEYKSHTGFLSGYSLVNFPFWVDGVAVKNDETYPGTFKGHKAYAAFPVYPWNRKGSLSNLGISTKGPSDRKSVLQTKTMSNLRVCLPSRYLNKSEELKISQPSLFDSDIVLNVNLSAWGKHVTYRGNIDKVLTFGLDNRGEDQRANVARKLIVSQSNYNDLNGDMINASQVPDAGNDDTIIAAKKFNIEYLSLDDKDRIGVTIDELNKFNRDPIPILYKSSSHAIFSFDYYNGFYEMLPGIFPSSGDVEDENMSYSSTLQDPLYWLLEEDRKAFRGLKQRQIKVDDPVLNYGDPQNLDPNDDAGYYFILGELYRDSVVNRFGGNSELALSNNKWNICGEAIYFTENSFNNNIELIGNQGDTYFERYDNLKTFPFAKDNVNNIVEIVSFMCETRINIDGRYDTNRGKKSNIIADPSNFNLFNKVYSLRNNFFQYPYINSDDVPVTQFPNQVVWSRPKVLGEKIDVWTNIKTINSIDLDGDKGSINALRRFNNEIYSFQDSGLSRILYNSRAAITPSDGVPIEIANGGKVDGKIYLSDKYGCQNKWSIAETPMGLYFIDNESKGIFLFNGSNIANLSDLKGMYSWVQKYSNSNEWNPKDFSNIRSLYDKVTGDVYFTNKEDSLAFNEKIGNFTSRYSYGNVSWLLNYEDTSMQVYNNDRGSSIWKMHVPSDTNDNYCNFFGVQYPYSISLITNLDFQLDKVIDTIEFRTNDKSEFKTYPDAPYKVSDNSIANYYPFKTLEVSNEYLKGLGDTASLKKKFRVWRWSIPRNNQMLKYTRDRIRNPWAKLTLKLPEDMSKYPLSLYDFIITYYI